MKENPKKSKLTQTFGIEVADFILSHPDLIEEIKKNTLYRFHFEERLKTIAAAKSKGMQDKFIRLNKDFFRFISTVQRFIQSKIGKNDFIRFFLATSTIHEFS